MTWENYCIVAGHDNQATVVNVETITPTGDTRAFCPPRSWGNYDPGIERIRGNGTITYAGKKQTRWTFAVMTVHQYEYALTTWEGEVTIRTRTTHEDYEYYNAVCHVPKLTEQQKKWMNLLDMSLIFTDLVAVSAP